MRRFRSSTSVLAIGAFAAVLAAAALAAPGSAGAAAGSTTVWVPEPLCAAPAPGHMACQAMRLVQRTVSTTGLAPTAARVRPALSDGPAGGYSPGQLAKAYGVNAGAATTQTVAIVDAFDDPTALADLNAFDDQYGLPHETATSFRKVNQDGDATPADLPPSDAGWAGEITLDVQAVRGLCHKCKILLVEATSNSNLNLGIAVNRAVTMGAKIVSNSYGGPESGLADPHYNHQGVAILASTGDDGWYGWDVFNEGGSSDDVPSSPASYKTVIAVGGTSLYLNADGTRAGEQVWNSNGPADFIGNNFGAAMGAAGSGCSTLYSPQLWQQKVSGYSTLGCGSTRRSGVDIAAIADPFTGFDIFQTFGNPTVTCPGTPLDCWATIGGTSLASPVVAALWGLAGGPGAVNYPSLSLYGHFKSDTVRPTYDVTIGGTGICHTATLTGCFIAAGSQNPNNLGAGDLDCGWSTTNLANDTPLANRFQCYAKPGFDGVSGVGTPIGLNVFKAMGPRAVITTSGTVTHQVAHSFSGASSTDPFPGGVITNYAWNWGDGHTSAGKTVSHTYATKGTRTITLTVTDNYARKGTKKLTITVH